LWIGCSALYLLVYLLLADLASDRTHGLFLALTILLPAIFVPLYIWRANFATRTEAVIRSVAPGLALSGLPATLLRLASRFHASAETYAHGRLQIGYVSVVLLLLGLVSGIELGLLRWKFLQWAPPPVILAGLRSTWRCYIKSATLWVAGVMVSGWMVTAFPSIHAADALAYAGIVVVGPGLLLIAPIPVFFSVGPTVNLGKRVWKYWLRCLSAAFGLLVLCLFAAMVLFRGPLIILYYFYSLPYLLLGFWLVCLPWALLSGLAEQPSARPLEHTQPAVENTGFAASPLAPDASLRFRPPATWKVLLVSLAAQLFILLPALWTASPSPLGLRGIGCVSAHYTNASE